MAPPAVRLAVAWVAKSLEADGAIVGLLPRVAAHVHLECVLDPEALPAVRALVGLLPGVGPDVVGQVGAVIADPGARGTLERVW